MANDLELHNVPGVLDPGSDDLPTALQQDFSRQVILFGRVNERFLLGYYDRFSSGADRLDADEIKVRFKVLFKESTLPLVRGVLKAYLKGETPLSLAQLAALRYPEGCKSFDRLARKLLATVVWPLRDLKIFQVEIFFREVQGKQDVERYAISAGPALVHFHQFVYVPLRLRQLRLMFEKFGKEVLDA